LLLIGIGDAYNVKHKVGHKYRPSTIMRVLKAVIIVIEAGVITIIRK